jgi:hypothetical protein
MGGNGKTMVTRKILLILSYAVCVSGIAWGSSQASRQYNFVNDRDNNIPIRAARVDAELDNIITKLNQKVLIKSTAPSTPVAGMLWYDSTNKILKQYRNAEWIGVGVHVSTSAPATAQEGDVWYDSTNNIIKIYNGSTWDLTLPDQSGHPNSYLRTDGSSADWDQISLDANIYGSLPIANGGTGQTTAQLAINALTAVSAATNEHVLTKDTATGDAIFKAATVLTARASDNFLISSDASKGPVDCPTYTKLKEIRLNVGGTLRIKIVGTSIIPASRLRIYRNGSAVGTARNTDGTVYSEDISGWTPGDLCQLYGINDAPGSNYYITTSNFRIYGDIGGVVTLD